MNKVFPPGKKGRGEATYYNIMEGGEKKKRGNTAL